MAVCSLESYTEIYPAYSSTYPDHDFAIKGPFLAISLYQFPHNSASSYNSKDKPVVAGSTKVSRKFSNSGAMRVSGVHSESGDLVSHIGDVASLTLLEEVDLSNNRGVVEPMVKGRY